MIALPDGSHELIPQWMTKPQCAGISIVLSPGIGIGALRNLRRLINSVIVSLPDKLKSKTRRDNGDSKISSITDHLERYTIADISSEGGPK